MISGIANNDDGNGRWVGTLPETFGKLSPSMWARLHSKASTACCLSRAWADAAVPVVWCGNPGGTQGSNFELWISFFQCLVLIGPGPMANPLAGYHVRLQPSSHPASTHVRAVNCGLGRVSESLRAISRSTGRCTVRRHVFIIAHCFTAGARSGQHGRDCRASSARCAGILPDPDRDLLHPIRFVKGFFLGESGRRRIQGMHK